jgi:hypothetical protein
MAKEFPANLDETLPVDDYWHDEVYAAVAVHCLHALEEKERFSPTMEQRRSFIKGYLTRLFIPERDDWEQGQDSQALARHFEKIDGPGARNFWTATNRVAAELLKDDNP